MIMAQPELWTSLRPVDPSVVLRPFFGRLFLMEINYKACNLVCVSGWTDRAKSRLENGYTPQSPSLPHR